MSGALQASCEIASRWNSIEDPIENPFEESIENPI